MSLNDAHHIARVSRRPARGGAALRLSGANANFVPDWTFKGSALTDWQPIGQTDWRAQNGEIVATPKSADGGWLVLNQSFQDVQLAASVRCTGACKPGVLIRAEKTSDGGMKGIFVSYAPTRRRLCDHTRRTGP